MSLLVYPKVISYTKFENFEIIRVLVMLRTNEKKKKTNRKQTNKQTDSKILRLLEFIFYVFIIVQFVIEQ